MYYKVIYNKKSDELKAKRYKDNKKVSKKECELHNVGDVYELTVNTFNIEHAVHLFWLTYYHEEIMFGLCLESIDKKENRYLCISQSLTSLN